MKELQDEGKVRHLGLSEVTVEEIKAAQQVFEVATVQNLYNLANRRSEDVLDYCEQEGIGFIPWYPLAAGGLAEPGGDGRGDRGRARRDTGPGCARLAARPQSGDSADPGHRLPEHLEENVAGAELELASDERARLDEAGGDS